MALDSSPLADGARAGSGPRQAGPSGIGSRRRSKRRTRGIQSHLKPIHAPMHMRSGSPASLANHADEVSAQNAISLLHDALALMEVARRHAMTVINHREATLEI